MPRLHHTPPEATCWKVRTRQDSGKAIDRSIESVLSRSRGYDKAKLKADNIVKDENINELKIESFTCLRKASWPGCTGTDIRKVARTQPDHRSSMALLSMTAWSSTSRLYLSGNQARSWQRRCILSKDPQKFTARRAQKLTRKCDHEDFLRCRQGSKGGEESHSSRNAVAGQGKSN